MKRLISALMALLLLSLAMVSPAFAADSSRSYEFDLSCNAQHQVNAGTGDILTIMLTLHRKDSTEPADMYAMQDEISYDPEFFEIVDGGTMLSSGVQNADILLRDGKRAYYLNFVSMSGGEEWKADTLIATFQVKVTGSKGSSSLVNENCLVSVKDGSGSYEVSAQDLKVIVSDECTVKFDPMDGSDPIEKEVKQGEKLTMPDEFTREGYYISGWYRDTDFTELWDFDKDTVQGNMTLYAKWEEGEPAAEKGNFNWWLIPLIAIPVILLALLAVLLLRRKTVTFEPVNGSEATSCRSGLNGKIKQPDNPKKEGAVFGGWYTEAEGGTRWNFDTDKVKANISLFAHWL